MVFNLRPAGPQCGSMQSGKDFSLINLTSNKYTSYIPIVLLADILLKGKMNVIAKRKLKTTVVNRYRRVIIVRIHSETGKMGCDWKQNGHSLRKHATFCISAQPSK